MVENEGQIFLEGGKVVTRGFVTSTDLYRYLAEQNYPMSERYRYSTAINILDKVFTEGLVFSHSGYVSRISPRDTEATLAQLPDPTFSNTLKQAGYIAAPFGLLGKNDFGINAKLTSDGLIHIVGSNLRSRLLLIPNPTSTKTNIRNPIIAYNPPVEKPVIPAHFGQKRSNFERRQVTTMEDSLIKALENVVTRSFEKYDTENPRTIIDKPDIALSSIVRARLYELIPKDPSLIPTTS